ncbi:serine/threonine-protein kinase N2-like [Xenopus laevis]|uniref:Serine/threonine-protein kinase N2-like n=2 Tax=Xenopus laevis TaxID=8355 RepID=A0A8J1MJ12_XENLA|nr:serine/threonine-protein kinase N2-like [Xenopus laevis]XP_041441366.1 serine/threonine-protein kinase N2-like [Xenopus laevis]
MGPLPGDYSPIPEDSQAEEMTVEEAETTQELQFSSFTAKDFRRIKVLGRGSFGKVLLVEYLPANIYCAIKVLKKDNIDSTDDIEHILTEKQIGQLVNPHSFIVDLYATFSTKNQLFFIMEFVAGGSLRTHLMRSQHFDLQTTKFYAACITLGLEGIHSKDVIHRDLKPGNLLMDQDGYIKIADFGMSKTGIGYGDRTNTMVGSPAYMAPEVVMEEEYSRAVDWWALGVIVYEMLLGTRPFTGYDRDFIYDSIVEDEPHYPSSLDSEAVSFISQLLKKNPEERLGSTPGNAADVAEHPFFNGIVWDDIIEKNVTAPFVPSLNGPEDVGYFDEEFTKLSANLTQPKGPPAEMASEIDEAFLDFNYAAF